MVGFERHLREGERTQGAAGAIRLNTKLISMVWWPWENFGKHHETATLTWLQPWLKLRRPTQPLLFSGARVILEDVKKLFQMRRSFSVWSDEIFNPCPLWDIHHHRFTHPLLTDGSGWQGRWQLTCINPAALHQPSLQSRNPSLEFEHQWGVLVGTRFSVLEAPVLGSWHKIASAVPKDRSPSSRDPWYHHQAMALATETYPYEGKREGMMDKKHLLRAESLCEFFTRATEQGNTVAPVLRAQGAAKGTVSLLLGAFSCTWQTHFLFALNPPSFTDNFHFWANPSFFSIIFNGLCWTVIIFEEGWLINELWGIQTRCWVEVVGCVFFHSPLLFPAKLLAFWDLPAASCCYNGNHILI